MNDSELAAAVHQHMGRLDPNTLQHALKLAMAVRDAERERCAKLVVDANAWRGGHGYPPVLGGEELAKLIRAA